MTSSSSVPEIQVHLPRDPRADQSDDERGDELLWNKDHPQFDRTHNGKTHQLPAFEHWFRSFADRRNEVVHEGIAGSQIYDESASPYKGNYLEVAERVVLEAILVTMHQLIPGHYWRTPTWRAIAAAFDGTASDGKLG